ncbi:hypothetical protein D3C72_1347680 [compost metagenome]
MLIGDEPRVAISILFCGSAKRSNPRSRKGLKLTMRAPRLWASRSSASMRGWLVPGFCPKMKIASAHSKSCSETVPLPTPICGRMPLPLGSWHMFEQSGKLFVPYWRTNSWYKNAASLLARPDV